MGDKIKGLDLRHAHHIIEDNPMTATTAAPVIDKPGKYITEHAVEVTISTVDEPYAIGIIVGHKALWTTSGEAILGSASRILGPYPPPPKVPERVWIEFNDQGVVLDVRLSSVSRGHEYRRVTEGEAEARRKAQELYEKHDRWMGKIPEADLYRMANDYREALSLLLRPVPHPTQPDL